MDPTLSNESPSNLQIHDLTHIPPQGVISGLYHGENIHPVQDIQQDQDSETIEEERRFPQRSRMQTQFFQPDSTSMAAVHVKNLKDPASLAEALNMADATEWKDAIDSELASLKSHQTSQPVPKPKHRKVLPTKFVFKRKLDSNGVVYRHKARFVVQGFLQGDVYNTFAPVVDFNTVRTVLAIAVWKGLMVYQMDVKTAFLHGKIEDEVFVFPPDGVDVGKPSEVPKLDKGLYGLKQSPRIWNEKWKSVMTDLRFQQLLSDECVYVRNKTWLLTYVDDIIIVSPNIEQSDTVKQQLSEALDVKDLGELRYFLGIPFIRNDKAAYLSQEH